MTEYLTTTTAIDFMVVHELVAPILQEVPAWPTAGTLVWAQLADTDPAKWAAVLDGARYGALHLQLRQEALAAASHDIAAAVDCAAIARIAQGRGPAYIERKKSA